MLSVDFALVFTRTVFEGVCPVVEKSYMHGSASFPSLFHLAEVFVFHTQVPVVTAV